MFIERAVTFFEQLGVAYTLRAPVLTVFIYPIRFPWINLKSKGLREIIIAAAFLVIGLVAQPFIDRMFDDSITTDKLVRLLQTEQVHKFNEERQKTVEKIEIVRGNFSGLNLTGADLSSLTIIDSNFRGTKLARANFDNSHVSAIFERAVLDGASLRNSNMEGANFAGAHLDGAQFVNADLKGAYFEGASFTKSVLANSNFEEAYLAYGPGYGRSNFIQADLGWSNFKNANFANAEMRSSNMMYANFERANMSGSDLREANLFRATFRDADMSGARMEGALVENANFDGAMGYPPG